MMVRLVALLLSLASVGFAADSGDSYLRVSFIDVGQGDAIWIQTPVDDAGGPARNILIDGGPDRGAKNRVPRYLSAYALPPGSTIDCVVATHPHDDHYPGLIDILEQYDVKMIVDTGFPKDGV
jgi:competence protein ComEC